MEDASPVLVQFRVTPALRRWFRDAAHADRMTLSEWLRGLALDRAEQVAPDRRPEIAGR